MISGSINLASVSHSVDNTTGSSPIKPIATMSQAEKVELANKIVDSKIDASEITSLCADPNFIPEFLNNEEVQTIVLTAALQSKEISDDLIQTLKDTACKLSMTPDTQASVMADTSQWHAGLRDKPTMVVAIKFFENLDAKNTIMDAIGKLSIANACLNRELDAAYESLFSDAKEVFRTQHLTVHAESQSTHQEVVTSTAILGPEKAKLLKLEADNPNDQSVKDLRAAFDLKAAAHNAKIDQSQQLEKTALALEKSRNQLQGFVDLLTGQTTQIANPNFYMSEAEVAAQQAAFMANPASFLAGINFGNR